MKHYKLVDFLSNLNVKPPPARTQSHLARTLSPPIDDFLATVLMTHQAVWTPATIRTRWLERQAGQGDNKLRANVVNWPGNTVHHNLLVVVRKS